MRIETGCVPVVMGNGKGTPFIIAEVGTTANGDLDTAFKLIDAAKEAGADAVKFQMIDPEFMSDKSVDYTYRNYKAEVTCNMYDMFSDLAFNAEQWKQIADYCRHVGIPFMTSVDALWHVDLCEKELHPIAYKIGAWDMRFYPLIRKVAQTGRPVLIDLGPALLGEIVQMFDELTRNGCHQVILMHENHGSYEQSNIATIPYLSQLFNVPVGWSATQPRAMDDVLAVTLGACVIEKKLTLDNQQLGHGHFQSMPPHSFKIWVDDIRAIRIAIGELAVKPSLEDLRAKDLYFTSIVYDADLPAGTVLEEKHFACRRPGVGISPMYIDRFVGLTLKQDVKRNTNVGWYDV